MTNPYPIKWRIAQYLELRWWKNYLSSKNKTDYLLWKRQYWQHFLHQISDVLAIPDDASILDAGCGPAGIFTTLAQQRVTAIDPLLHRYSQEIAHFTPKDYPYVSFIATPLERFRPDHPFDIVFCLNAINHVSDIELAFERLADTVKIGGYLVLSIDAHRHNILKKLFRLLPADALHPHQYSLPEYVQLLEQHPFTILKTQCLKQSLIFGYWVIVAQKNGQ